MANNDGGGGGICGGDKQACWIKLNFICNFLGILVNLLLMIIGIVYIVTEEFTLNELYTNEYLADTITILIIIAVLGIVVNLVGCIFTKKENEGAMKLYLIILLVVAGVELLVGFLLVGQFQKSSDEIVPWMSKSMRQYYGDKEIQRTWDNAMEEYHCCGVLNYQDWSYLGMPMPDECCNSTLAALQKQVPIPKDSLVSVTKKSAEDTCSVQTVYKAGCSEEFTAVIRDALETLMVFAFFAAGFQILVVLSMLLLGCNVKPDDDDGDDPKNNQRYPQVEPDSPGQNV